MAKFKYQGRNIGCCALRLTRVAYLYGAQPVQENPPRTTSLKSQLQFQVLKPAGKPPRVPAGHRQILFTFALCGGNQIRLAA
jgi:hypothetical protein